MQPVAVGLVSPTVTEPPKATAEPFIVIAPVPTIAELGTFEIVLLEPLMVLFVKVCVAVFCVTSELNLALFKVPAYLLEALLEAIQSNQSADTVFKSYKLVFTENRKTWNRILNLIDIKDLQRSLRGGVSGGRDLSPGMRADD